MERYQVMVLLKKLYEEIIESQDAKIYLLHEERIDQLFNVLHSKENKQYDLNELVILSDLNELNNSIQALIELALNRMQKSHDMAPLLTKQYETAILTESYFIDRKQ
ncbi:hypothetical protein [Paenibacillus xylanilyticus]|uniref:hypothetical protein n=1 Tax=Paenibacillus xylanilyticus TaxID=248903 RepID=UPI00129DDEE5|nr:hypothetical protein [Paenibacillus xylanilyticus]